MNVMQKRAGRMHRIGPEGRRSPTAKKRDIGFVHYQITREVVSEIKARVSIVDVVGRYVSLKKQGRTFKGLCPFHSEKTPSFQVDDTRRRFHCFGCGVGGDVIEFLMSIDHKDFMEAVIELAEQAGVTLPEKPSTPAQRRTRSEREAMFALNQKAASFFAARLLGARAQAARNYLKTRSIDSETANAFGIGYAPEGWTALVEYFRSEHLSFPLAQRVGLIKEGQRGWHDRFSHRLMFPIRDVNNRVIAFGARILGPGEPKYLNSPESPLFSKSNALYGLDLARQSIRQEDAVVVVEGYFDVIALHQAGIRHVVATCGTALTPGHVHLLRRYSKNIILIFDGDRAGLAAAEKSLGIFLEEGVWPSYVALPSDKDPDDTVREEGAEAFRARLARSIPLLEHVILSQTQLIQSPSDADRALEDLAPIFLLVRRLKPFQSDYYINFIAQHFDVSPSVVHESFRRVISQKKGNPPSAPFELPKPAPRGPARPHFPSQEAFLIQWLLLEPGEVLPAAVESNIVEWLTHPGLKDVMKRALAQYEEGSSLDVDRLIDESEDPSLKQGLSALCMEELMVDPSKRQEALAACIRGIKKRNIEVLLRQVQGQIAQLGQKGGAPSEEEIRLLKWKTELRHTMKALKKSGGSTG